MKYITVDIFEKNVPRANLICTSRGKVFLSILTSRRCRSHLKLRTLFILLNDASERNINIMGKTCKSPGTINAEGNHRRSLEQPGSLEAQKSSAMHPTGFHEITYLPRRDNRVTFCRSRKVLYRYLGGR